MAHFTKLDENNIVTQVIVVSNNELLDAHGQEREELGVAFCQKLFGGNWKQTSYNHNMRVRYAGIGYTYDTQRDAFIPPKSYASWTLNEDTCDWEPSTPRPLDDKMYGWNESTQSWDAIE